jgi:hypothetical protein
MSITHPIRFRFIKHCVVYFNRLQNIHKNNELIRTSRSTNCSKYCGIAYSSPFLIKNTMEKTYFKKFNPFFLRSRASSKTENDYEIIPEQAREDQHSIEVSRDQNIVMGKSRDQNSIMGVSRDQDSIMGVSRDQAMSRDSLTMANILRYVKDILQAEQIPNL